MDDGKVLVGFVVGLATGAVAALLAAPSSGAETRRVITDRASGYSHDANEKLSGLLDKVSDFVDTTLAKINKQADTQEASASTPAPKTPKPAGTTPTA